MQLVFKQHLKFQKHDFAFDWSCIYQTNQSLNKMVETMPKNKSKKLSRRNDSAIFNEVLPIGSLWFLTCLKDSWLYYGYIFSEKKSEVKIIVGLWLEERDKK